MKQDLEILKKTLPEQPELDLEAEKNKLNETLKEEAKTFTFPHSDSRPLSEKQEEKENENELTYRWKKH